MNKSKSWFNYTNKQNNAIFVNKLWVKNIGVNFAKILFVNNANLKIGFMKSLTLKRLKYLS